jgi:hypothetical protein
MAQVMTAGPSRLIDVQLELLHLSGDSWQAGHDDHLLVGDRVALRCLNRGDREISGAVCMRTMTGRLRSVSDRVQDLWPGQSVEFGTSAREQVFFTEQDVEIALLASHYEAAVEEMLQTLRDGTAVPAELTILSLDLKGEAPEVPLSDDDLLPLLSVAQGGQFEISVQALRALTLLQPPDSVTETLSCMIRDQLRLPQLLHRPWLISVAANLADEGVRQHLRGIAADSADPHSRAAQQALSEVGDADALPTVTALLQGSDEEAQRAARILATRYPDFGATQLRGEDLPSGPRAFWVALASARQGSFTALRQHTTAIDNAGFQRLLGDAATTYYAARDMIPVPVDMRLRLYEAQGAHGLPTSVIEFYDLLLSEAGVSGLPDGVRTVPDYCVAEIRQQLDALPGITDLKSYISEGRTGVWDRVAGLTPAHRGVLLNELLKSAVAQPTQPLAAAAVDYLIRRWNHRQPWYPNISGQLEVLRDLGGTPLSEARLGIELQVGWLLSRAPITQLLRLVNDRIVAGESVEVEIRALSNAVVTHWDPIPPPRTADVARVPQKIQTISATRPVPSRRTRAWLTGKHFSEGRWTATLTISIGEAHNAPRTSDPPGTVVPQDNLKATSQLIIVPPVRTAGRSSRPARKSASRVPKKR